MTNSDSRATGEQGAIAEPAGASVAPEDSVKAVEAMLAAHNAYDNPCVAQRRELAWALKPFADYAKCGGDDDDSVRIGHYFGGPTMGECRKARALLAAHPEWFK